MEEAISPPDVSMLDIPKDQWTQGFWESARTGRLALSRCGACGRWRWPPGPFCPACHSQAVRWEPPGIGRLYSYTILHGRPAAGQTGLVVVGLVEFPDAQGIRIAAAIAGVQPGVIAIGTALDVRWSPAGGDRVPFFVPRACAAASQLSAIGNMDVQT